jgi:hypothetical protein
MTLDALSHSNLSPFIPRAESPNRLSTSNSREKDEAVPMSDSVQPESQRLLDAAASQGLERHTTRSGFIRDAIIGLADGLTVPFAVTASLSS